VQKFGLMVRLAELDNKGGMAAVAGVDHKHGRFATVSATGRLSTFGFGSLEQGPNRKKSKTLNSII
jgi:cell surface protein SprA